MNARERIPGARAAQRLLQVAAAALLLLGCGGEVGPKGDKGATGATGPTGPAGSAGDPALILLDPIGLAQGKTGVVRLSGLNTHFSQTATSVDFGDAEVKPSGLTVGGVLYLQVQVQVTAQARLGAHDVTVTTKGAGTGGTDEKVALKGVFAVSAAALQADPSDDQ